VKPAFLLPLLLSMLPHDAAAQFSSAVITAGGRSLEYRTTANSAIEAAPLLKDQTGFQDAKVSPDAKLMGWLAEYPNCCTSYAVPLELIVMDRHRRLHSFSGPQAIFGWCFASDSKAVAFRQTALHGRSNEVFELRRVQDGKLLQRFVLVWSDPDDESRRPQVPRWARCAVG